MIRIAYSDNYIRYKIIIYQRGNLKIGRMLMKKRSLIVGVCGPRVFLLY